MLGNRGSTYATKGKDSRILASKRVKRILDVFSEDIDKMITDKPLVELIEIARNSSVGEVDKVTIFDRMIMGMVILSLRIDKDPSVAVKAFEAVTNRAYGRPEATLNLSREVDEETEELVNKIGSEEARKVLQKYGVGIENLKKEVGVSTARGIAGAKKAKIMRDVRLGSAE